MRTAQPGLRRYGWALLPVGSVALAVVAVIGLRLAGLGVHPSDAVPTTAAAASITVSGSGNLNTDPFYLAGGTYRGDWSAWGVAAEYPPCTHSAELLALDPTAGGEAMELAHLVDVPATGASAESLLYNLKPGDYYLSVTSACSWQIAINPT